MLRFVYLVAAGAAFIYIGVLLGLWHYQERVLFQPPRNVPDEPVAARRVSYPAADGVELFAYLVGDCAAPALTVVAFHGNAEVSRWSVPWASRVARETGACIMLPEYRGYDGISGGPTYATSGLDAKAAADFLKTSLGVSPSNIVLYGHSLGSAVAAELASHQPPRALILQSPLTTARAMAARLGFPGMSRLWWLISRIHFDTPSRVRSLLSPVWVAHGDRDVVIPVRMGREVFGAASNKGELLVVHGAGHNDVAEVGGDEYWAWLVRAIKSGAARPAGATPAVAAEK